MLRVFWLCSLLLGLFGGCFLQIIKLIWLWCMTCFCDERLCVYVYFFLVVLFLLCFSPSPVLFFFVLFSLLLVFSFHYSWFLFVFSKFFSSARYFSVSSFYLWVSCRLDSCMVDFFRLNWNVWNFEKSVDALDLAF